MRLVANDVAEYTLDREMKPELMDKLPDTLRNAAKNYVTKSCFDFADA